jgi:hypothetical protein
MLFETLLAGLVKEGNNGDGRRRCRIGNIDLVVLGVRAICNSLSFRANTGKRKGTSPVSWDHRRLFVSAKSRILRLAFAMRPCDRSAIENS